MRALLCAALLVAAADDIATKKRLVIKHATKRKPPCSARVEEHCLATGGSFRGTYARSRPRGTHDVREFRLGAAPPRDPAPRNPHFAPDGRSAALRPAAAAACRARPPTGPRVVGRATRCFGLPALLEGRGVAPVASDVATAAVATFRLALPRALILANMLAPRPR